MFLDAFGPIRTPSHLFGCVPMRLDAFGIKWRVSERNWWAAEALAFEFEGLDKRFYLRVEFSDKKRS